MSIRIPHEHTLDISQGVTRVRIDKPFIYGDSQSHRFIFTINEGNTAAVLTGYTATLYAVRLADKVTVPNEGTIDGNVVTIDNVQSDFLTRGRVDLLLTLSAGGEQVTLFWGEGTCSGGITDTIADPAETIPTLSELLAQISAMETATGEAVAAAATANDAAASANTAAGNAQDAADAITGITVEAGAVAYGNPPTATVEEDPGDGHLNIVFGLPTGPTGIRGTRTYSGTAITGTSTTPTAYATGIDDAIVNDRYHYDGTVDVQRGNVYKCTLGGNASTALWIYDGNIRGIAGNGSVNTVDNVSPDGNGNVDLCALKTTGGNMTGAINEALVASMALSGTMNIGAAAGNYIIVTAGTGPITAFDSAPAGARRFMRFSVSATINYNATTMLIPGAANLDVVSGDVLEWVSGGSGVWRCVNIERWNRIEPSTLQDALLLKLQPVLLWPNEAPTSRFNEQLIERDWTGYTSFIIEYTVNIAEVTQRCVAFVPAGESTPFHYLGAFATNYWRQTAINTSGVYFSGGFYRADGGAATADDTKMIPYKIWGLKEITL